MYEISEFSNFDYIIELEPDFGIEAWDPSDISDILNIKEDELNYLVERTGKEAKREGIKKVYNINFIFEDNEIVDITSIGMYLLISLNHELKKFPNLIEHLNYFKDLALFNLLRYQGHKQNKRKTKRTNNIPEEFRAKSFEDLQKYSAKKISPDLKAPDEDIVNKSHLFYGKKILITGEFDAYFNRNELAKLIHDVGGFNKGIAKSLDYVIIGNNPGPSKMKKIKDWGLKTLTEHDVVEMFPNFKSIKD